MPTPPAAARVTLGFDVRLWRTLTTQAGYTDVRALAGFLGVNRATLYRICNGGAAPGPEFIAAVRTRFPAVDSNRLFPVVAKPVAV